MAQKNKKRSNTTIHVQELRKELYPGILAGGKGVSKITSGLVERIKCVQKLELNVETRLNRELVVRPRIPRRLGQASCSSVRIDLFDQSCADVLVWVVWWWSWWGRRARDVRGVPSHIFPKELNQPGIE